jgi:tetratricopeptide (TPR) repeat protein
MGRRSGECHLIAQLTDCYRRLSQIYYLDGDSTLLLVYINLRGLNIGELGSPSDPLARILSNMGTLCGFSGALRWSDWYAGAAVAMAESGAQFSAAAYVWSVNSLTFAQRGSWQVAKAANAEALRRVQELGDFNQEAEAWVIRATIALCEGNFNEAPQAWQNARTLAVQRGNDQILCWSLLDEVDTCLGRDDVESAARVLDQALAVPTASSDGSSRIDKCRATAMVRYRQGRYGESVAAADEVMEMIFRQAPSGYHWVDFFASAVEVYLLILDEDHPYSRQHRRRLLLQARRGCRQLLRLSRSFGNVVPRSRLLLSRLALCQGQRRQARRMAQRALVLATARGMPYERALALLELGALEPQGLDGRQKLREALSIFQFLGATAAGRRTGALLSD